VSPWAAAGEAPVAVLASRVRTEEKRILAALRRRNVRHEHVDCRRLWGRLGAPRPWPVVLNREIGQARAVYAARMLESGGARVLNSALATEICGDKWRCSQALADAGLPVPRTALGLTPEAALDALDAVGYPAVIKPLTGSWGRLVTRVADREAAAAVLEHVAALPSPQSHLGYVQEWVASPGRDIRVIVIGGNAVAAAYRLGREWRSNVARGAASVPCPLTEELAKLAIGAAVAVRADIAGVDLIEDGGGRVLVLEVNHGVEFAGLQQAAGAKPDIAEEIVDHLLARAA
jgi:[lysine-biosynthesis-protein LysW]---L-2-aminoadipate ligase